MDATRQHVEIGHGILALGNTPRNQRQAALRAGAATGAREAISQLRYDKQEYFWINDVQPRVVMHPTRPELNGKDVSDLKDPNGLALFSAFTNTVRQQGKGFVNYQWPKPGSSAPVDKISYVQGFEPWGWVIGTGICIDDSVTTTFMHQLRIAGVGVLFTLLVGGYLF